MKCPFSKCPLCEYDLLLEDKRFFSFSLPKTRYFQAHVKYSKIIKLAKAKEYKDRLGNSGRIRDLIKDCLNDMEMALELRYGKEFKTKWTVIPPKSPCYSCQYGNIQFWHKSQFLRKRKKVKSKCWEPWMNELAEIRNHAIHKGTAFGIIAGMGVYYLRAESLNGKITQTSQDTLPYLKKTLEKIKGKLKITEI